ncbi:MAG TPA: malto-oligosyltrehalose synthase [Gaiellales bacterium]
MRLPASCYRLQLSPAFTLDDARRAAPYLRDLGVGDLYLSPILAARPGSTHGYDVCDPTRVNPELGGLEALERLAGELSRLDMGLIVDVVPNHQAADRRNPWWWDVLLRGRASAWAHAFDIEWDAPGADGRLVLPLLGSERADAIARGELRLVEEDGEARIAYFDGRYPVAAGTDGGDLEAVLATQHYRLEDWRTGVPNYRRFFDIADLPAIAVEHEDVFRATHAEIVRLVRAGIVTGLRIDHIDGLRDPAEYLERLRDATGGAYVVVEKILARDESLPEGWATAGTTGYEFLALAGGLFVDPAGFTRVKAVHRRLTGERERFEDIAEAAKRAALEGILAPDLARVCRTAPAGVGTDAVRDLTVALDVYRTYIGEGEARPADAARLQAAGERAGGDGEALATTIARPAGELRPFVARWQQLTGPAAAKGVEDTAVYVDAALLARNEPGCAPDWPFTGVAELHARLAERAGGHPLNATSTHDTKRSEDVRMRISALSELADDWERAFARWHEANAPLRRRPDTAPDANEEWLLYQTLLGAWPIDIQRVCQFVVKALREAKVHTSWAAPDEAYEADVIAFAEAILASPEFTGDLAAFGHRCAAIGARSSLALLVLKLAAPGVPDIYWGNEDWDLSLVDPDNRRPVDFAARAEPGAGRSDKVAVTRAGLALRRRDPELFAHGAYMPVEVAGRHADGVVAFARVHEGRWALAAVARLTAAVDGWADTRLVLPDRAPDGWHDVLTGSPATDLSAEALFAAYPAALLTGCE